MWETLPRDQWPSVVHEYILRDFDIPEHDDIRQIDRRQEVVFIGPTPGEGFALRVVSKSLDQCLLTDEEFEEYQSIVAAAATATVDQQLHARVAPVLESRYVSY